MHIRTEEQLIQPLPVCYQEHALNWESSFSSRHEKIHTTSEKVKNKVNTCYWYKFRKKSHWQNLHTGYLKKGLLNINFLKSCTGSSVSPCFLKSLLAIGPFIQVKWRYRHFTLQKSDKPTPCKHFPQCFKHACGHWALHSLDKHKRVPSPGSSRSVLCVLHAHCWQHKPTQSLQTYFSTFC